MNPNRILQKYFLSHDKISQLIRTLQKLLENHINVRDRCQITEKIKDIWPFNKNTGLRP